MRNELSDFLVENAMKDPKFVVLSGDHGYALFDDIRTKAPSQFLNVGVSEQAMIGYAAGLAKSGFRVAVYGLAAFVPCRVFEFIKMDICYDNLPVIILGDGAGLIYNTLGASHQCAEDIAMMRTLPNLDVFSPADLYELRQCAEYAIGSSKASYLRIGKCDLPTVHKGHLRRERPRPVSLVSGTAPMTIMATGSMVSTALSLSDELKCSVISVPILSERDPNDLASLVRRGDIIVTLEEHSIHGGLGSFVAEQMTMTGSHSRIVRVGIRNRFTEKNGDYNYALSEHGIDKQSILSQLKELPLS